MSTDQPIRRFCLLRHAPGPANAEIGTHWDLLIESASGAALWAWRLAEDPTAGAASLACERNADHRPVYLTFSGELSDRRGCVERVDGGVVSVRPSDDGLWLCFEGEALNGAYSLQPADGVGRFTRAGGLPGAGRKSAIP
ncbi:MAG: hypothetical protein KDA32_01180 [Phycisphaerales bacterium]|nr:hypothetical protein [Phycisphaerales bacterium]